jgi:hypothetical protein
MEVAAWIRQSFHIVVTIVVSGCLFVKPTETKVEVRDVSLSPTPEMEMGDDLVRTRTGDMIALLPKGWVFLDARSESSADVVAVAVDPNYTVAAVFSSISGLESPSESSDSEGMLGLARRAYSRHARKTAGGIRLVGSYTEVAVGLRRFGLYTFAGSTSSAPTRCAVFTSSVGHHYQLALVPLSVSGRDQRSDAELQQIFRSILATIQY